MPITQEYLKRLLHYDPISGVFTWIEGRSRTPAGSVAGSLDPGGYLTVMIDSRRHSLHRLAFLYMDGAFPPEMVDHINGVRADNRWRNLRPASARQNSRNQRLNVTNKSGLPGVMWDRRSSWRAYAYVNGRCVTLGRYESLLSAAAARMSFENQNGYHHNHGK
ncbi:hypothetical protein GIV19_16745 [Pseudomonas syringae]|uniref:HNH endonuclease n=1 Tax=Pseudomonas syringae TaxID=317 RepID=UPI001FA5F467|nr:hypothetical protein [Pseudomonas syringae]